MAEEAVEEAKELGDGEVRKPGQKFVTPSPGFSDRVFYESLLAQRPDSHMAQEWCVQYGVLSVERAEELLVQINRRKGKGGGGGGGSRKSPSKPAAKAAKKRKVEDDTSVVAETGLGVSSGVEGVGSVGV